MRTFWGISLALALSATYAQGQYFPKSSLDFRGDNFKDNWYSSQLRALHEPSLLQLAKTTKSESYRFLWLRTFHHPIAIRLDVKPDGTGVLITKVSNGAGGYRPGILLENKSQLLIKEQTQAFLVRLDKVGFWKAPNPLNDQKGTDGSQWIIEGAKKGKYHVIDRWTPQSGIARELGLMFAFDLAKIKIPTDEVY